MNVVTVGGRTIGAGAEPFFVAELGICHEGRLDVALELTRKAAAAGAHCVKTETFQRETLVYDPSATATFTIRGETLTVPLIEHMDQYGLTFEEHGRIKQECDLLGLPFMSTAHDKEAVDFLVGIGAAAIKIASPDIVHGPLLRYVAGTKLPVFLDTGSALQTEIETAVGILRANGGTQVVVNHNPAGHPSPAERHDLRIIPRLQQVLGVPVGLADHYEGYDMAWAAVAVGADTVEKPVSRDRFVPEPERNYSISIDDLPDFLRHMATIYSALGRSERTLDDKALAYRRMNRVAMVTAADLDAGTVIDETTVTFGRPRKGIGVEFFDEVKGLKLRRRLAKGSFITWTDLD